MRVVLVQMAASTDAMANTDVIAGLLESDSVRDTADLVVLPEAAMQDFGLPDFDLAAVAEPLDGPFVGLLQAHARRLDATIVAGMFERTDSLPFNTLVAVQPDGTLAATYRKIHLYDSFGYRESDRLTPGPVEPQVIEVAGMKVGLMTCYDLRFPEQARALAAAGAEAIVLPAAWVAGERKLHHWRTLLTARAIENTVYMAAAAQAAPRYEGHSALIHPLGDVVIEAGPGPEIIQGTIDPDEVVRAREINPSLKHRRFPA